MKQWFHPAFETDLIAAAQRLGRDRAGFDRLFFDEAELAIATIMQSPATWRPWHATSAASYCRGFATPSAIASAGMKI